MSSNSTFSKIICDVDFDFETEIEDYSDSNTESDTSLWHIFEYSMVNIANKKDLNLKEHNIGYYWVFWGLQTKHTKTYFYYNKIIEQKLFFKKTSQESKYI